MPNYTCLSTIEAIKRKRSKRNNERERERERDAIVIIRGVQKNRLTEKPRKPMKN
jgi:hypothetical protein